MRAININVLQKLKYDYQLYKSYADDEMRCEKKRLGCIQFFGMVKHKE